MTRTKCIYLLLILLMSIMASGCSESKFDVYKRLLLGVSNGKPINTARDYNPNGNVHKIALVRVINGGESTLYPYNHFPYEWKVGIASLNDAELVGIITSKHIKYSRCSYTGSKSIYLKLNKTKIKIYKAKTAEFIAEKSFSSAKPKCPATTVYSGDRVGELNDAEVGKFFETYVFSQGFLKSEIHNKQITDSKLLKEKGSDKRSSKIEKGNSAFMIIVQSIVGLALLVLLLSDDGVSIAIAIGGVLIIGILIYKFFNAYIDNMRLLLSLILVVAGQFYSLIGVFRIVKSFRNDVLVVKQAGHIFLAGIALLGGAWLIGLSGDYGASNLFALSLIIFYVVNIIILKIVNYVIPLYKVKIEKFTIFYTLIWCAWIAMSIINYTQNNESMDIVRFIYLVSFVDIPSHATRNIALSYCSLLLIFLVHIPIIWLKLPERKSRYIPAGFRMIKWQGESPQYETLYDIKYKNSYYNYQQIISMAILFIFSLILFFYSWSISMYFSSLIF